MTNTIALGVNIDHVATLRQARRARYPDPVHAALLAEQAGADSITLHLREDRRHIQDSDVIALRERLQTRMNLEMAVTDEMLDFARSVRPADCCLVPERRAEVTTEGGLDVAGQRQRIREACALLAAASIRVALFIDPDPAQIEAALEVGAPVIELHTGAYAEASGGEQARELDRLRSSSRMADNFGLEVHAGHGLHYHNVRPVAAIGELTELNIGHAIIARAVFDGLGPAVREMKQIRARRADDRPAMIYGIGIDVLEARRIERSRARFGERFAERLLMPAERAQYGKTRRPDRFLAMRFAAKEAIVKAMGTGFAHGMWIRDCGVVQNAWGRPEVVWSPRGERLRRKLGIGEGHVTLTDEAGLVVAVAVLLRAPPARRARAKAAPLRKPRRPATRARAAR